MKYPFFRMWTWSVVILAMAPFLPVTGQTRQAPEAAWELFATGGGGWSLLGADEAVFSLAPYVSGGVGRRLTPRVGMEAAGSVVWGARTNPTERFEGLGAALTGNVVYHFSEGRIQPYVLGGTGVIRWERKSTYFLNGETSTFSSRRTSLAKTFAGGVKAYVGPDLYIRAEARLLAGHHLPDVLAAFGLGYRW